MEYFQVGRWVCFRDNINELHIYYYVFESFAFSSGCIFSKYINILPFVEVNIHQFHSKKVSIEVLEEISIIYYI